ncbi:hypothetical protein SEA_ORLA_66 [Gordonia phage Orla]|nr:hypothetical protein SEA_ORLA_66 [Gordonia phage Orla]
MFERTSMDARFRAHQAGNEKERRNIWGRCQSCPPLTRRDTT